MLRLFRRSPRPMATHQHKFDRFSMEPLAREREFEMYAVCLCGTRRRVVVG